VVRSQNLRSRLNRKGRTAAKLVSQDPSLGLLLKVVWGKISHLPQQRNEGWLPSIILDDDESLTGAESLRIAIVAHLHYEEYVDTLLLALEGFPLPYDLFISSSKEPLIERSRATFSPPNGKLLAQNVPNRGRNLAPLFVEFGAHLANYDLVIHVHSKKSLHNDSDYAETWSRELWQYLLSDPHVVRRAINQFLKDEKIGIYYPLASVIPLRIFNWAKSETLAKEWSESQNFPHRSGEIPFPAGGMFWFKPAALQPILDSHFTYSDFPEEKGQIDETLQHALERLIGTVPLALGFKHMIYHVHSNILTTDVSFAGKSFFKRQGKGG